MTRFQGNATDDEVKDGAWSAAERVPARVSLDPPLLAMEQWSIERQTRRWQREPGGKPVGYCQRLPLWESIEIIAARAPGESSR